MPKRIRVSIAVGIVALSMFGAFLIMAGFATMGAMQKAAWWYSGPQPGIFFIPGILCIIAAVLLLSVATYEVRNHE
jgi:UPF0716 family protein affecting phage T7 exclusion